MFFIDKLLGGKKHILNSQQNAASIPESSEGAHFKSNVVNIEYFVYNASFPPDNQSNVATQIANNTMATRPPTESTKFGWIQCIAACVTCAICFALIASFYDYLIFPVTAVVGPVGLLIAILPFVVSHLGWKTSQAPAKLANFLSPLALGALLSIGLSLLFCGCMGLRLSIVPPVVDAPSPSPVAEPTPVWPNREDNTITATPTPGATSAPPPAGLDDNKEIPEPPLITPHSDEADKDPQRVQADFFALISYSSDAEHTQFVASDMNLWRAIFANEMKQLIGMERDRGEYDKIQMEFEGKTTAANVLFAQLTKQADQIAAISEIIQLREEAYELYPTQSLCGLLAEDYHRLAEEYKRNDDRKNTYQSYYNAVKWRMAYTQRLTQIDDSFYDALYSIATIYHEVGSSEWLSDKERIDAHYISACLFSAASQHIFSADDTQYLSCLYTGMTIHKLLNLNTADAPSESAAYFLEAYAYYETALEFQSKDKKRICGYLSDICTWAEQYSKKYPEEPLLQDPSVYKNLAEEYKKRSL